MAHWYDDPRKVRRAVRHIRWYYTNQNSVAEGLKPKDVRLPAEGTSKVTDPIKALIKDSKKLSGYLAKYQTWGASLDNAKAFQKWIDALHHPTTLGPAATERGKKARAARRRPELTGVRAKAQAVLNHPGLDLHCYTSPTGGDASVGLKEIVADGTARVASPESIDQGRYTRADERVLDFLLDFGDANRDSPACITCIINGDHSEDSEHYDFHAIDIGKGRRNNRLYACAAANGLVVLDEDSVHYHVHT